MTDFYTQIEDAIVAVLQASPDLTAIRTWATEIPEGFYVGQPLAKMFRSEQLPAVMVTAVFEPTRSRPASHAEILYAIPAQVILVTKSPKKRDARAQAISLLRPMEAALHQLRYTSASLGSNTFLYGDLSSEISTVEAMPVSFGLASITAEIHKVVPL